MGLSGAAAAALAHFPAQIAADELDGSRAFAGRAEVERERPFSVKVAQRMQAVADPREQPTKLRLTDNPSFGFQLGGRQEAHADALPSRDNGRTRICERPVARLGLQTMTRVGCD